MLAVQSGDAPRPLGANGTVFSQSITSAPPPPGVLEIARNMVESPDNWPPMRVKEVAEALIIAAGERDGPQTFKENTIP